MKIDSLADYWGKQIRTEKGKWVHPDDKVLLDSESHSFNLDFPAPAFVGDILRAKIIILAANGGYDSVVTSQEFKEDDATKNYMYRLNNPSKANWSAVAPYYQGVNYAHLILNGRAAIVNACAYRSKKISEEPENKKLIKKLSSVAVNRSWLLDCLLPLARSGDRIIIAKRHGLWNLPKILRQENNVIFDPAPVSPHLSRSVWDIIKKHIEQ
jgi:hypothetical protein